MSVLNSFILWSSLIVPWLSLIFLRKGSIKRYMPVAVFTSLIMTLYNELGFTYHWWIVKQTLFPSVITFVPFVFGCFMAGTIWIFYFTYRKFWLYMMTNIVIDFLFMFPGDYGFERLGIYQLLNRSNWNIYLDFLLISLVIYCYQLWQEGAFKNPKAYTDNDKYEVDLGKLFRAKGRVK